MPRRAAYRLLGNFLKNFDEKKYAYKVMAEEEYGLSIANTEFVSSRGILANCDIKSEHPRSSYIDFPYLDSIRKRIESFNPRPNCPITIHVCTDGIPYFSSYVAPYIEKPLNLVTGDSDLSVSPASLKNAFWQLLEHRHLLNWFAQNRNYSHQKLHSLPIGLDYHSFWCNPKIWGGGPILPSIQESQIRKIKKEAPQWRAKIPLAYCDWIFSINHGNRKECKELLHRDSCFFPENRQHRALSWNAQSHFSFIASPSGAGIDCHRTWEAIALGLIPIIERNLCNDLFADLPVLIIDSWEEVNLENLLSKFKSHQEAEFNLIPIRLDYWLNKISSPGYPSTTP
jgi:hypothetical protein